jgi:hypothetical protein
MNYKSALIVLLISMNVDASGLECKGLAKMITPPEGQLLIERSRLNYDSESQVVKLFIDLEDSIEIAQAQWDAQSKKINFKFSEEIDLGDIRTFEASVELNKVTEKMNLSLESQIENQAWFLGLYECTKN